MVWLLVGFMPAFPVLATQPWRFAFVGDTHVPLTTTAGEIASAALADNVQFLIVAGDLVESGSGASTTVLARQLAAWESEMGPLRSNNIPVYVVRGNHEDDVQDNLPTWNNFFSGPLAMPDDGPVGETNITYSTALTYSNALIVGLDDYVNIHQINQAWLNQVLATNRLPHVFVYGHEPAFKAFHTDCLGSVPTSRNNFWASLTAAGARCYLCGHDHFLNIARIDDGDGNPGNDLYQVIVGTGGSTNWPNMAYNYNGTNAPYAPINLYSVTKTFGYLLVEISGTGSNDLGVTMTWKERVSNNGVVSYVATTNVLSYSAINLHQDSVGDGVPDWWRAKYFGGNGTTTNATSCAACDADGDGFSNYQEYVAGTDPTNAADAFQIRTASALASGFKVSFQSVLFRNYSLYYTSDLSSGSWAVVPGQNAVLGDGGVDTLSDTNKAGGPRFYRVSVSLP